MGKRQIFGKRLRTGFLLLNINNMVPKLWDQA